MTEPSTPKVKEPTSPLQKKYLGLPLWIYIVAVGLLIFIVIYYRRKSASASSSTDTTSSTMDNTQSAATVPPFINQVYTNTEPPEASAIPKTPTPTESASDKKQETRTIRKPISWKHLVGYLHINSAELAKLNPSIYKKYGKHGNIPVGTVIRYAP